MVRLATFVVLLLAGIAVAGGLADALHGTVFVPAAPAILTVHLAWSGVTLPMGVGLAILAGYLQDLDSGGVIGLSALAYGLAFVGLHRIARRISAPGAVGRALWSGLWTLLVDVWVAVGLYVLLPWVRLAHLAERSVWQGVFWHVAATALWAPAVWLAADRIYARVGLFRRGLAVEGGGARR